VSRHYLLEYSSISSTRGAPFLCLALHESHLLLQAFGPSQSSAHGYQLCTLCTGCQKRRAHHKCSENRSGMSISYDSKNKRTIRYKSSKDYKEFSLSSQSTRRVRVTTPKNRPRQSRIWGIVLTIIRLGLEVATKLIGSGKCRSSRLLPE
jgi:hypothetical protein